MQHRMSGPQGIMLSNEAAQVREFTEGAGFVCAAQPQPLSKEEVIFLLRMVLSEMTELAQTVTPNLEAALEMLHQCVGVDVKPHHEPPAEALPLMAQQYDALVDAWYYMHNAAVKKGVDLSALFQVVHAANMAKKWPDGKFHRREDGKIMKPPTWQEPDIVGEIKRQSGQ